MGQPISAIETAAAETTPIFAVKIQSVSAAMSQWPMNMTEFYKTNFFFETTFNL